VNVDPPKVRLQGWQWFGSMLLRLFRSLHRLRQCARSASVEVFDGCAVIGGEREAIEAAAARLGP
jgi:hypothetical protein